MKLKKGSLEAKRFMAKIRAKKKPVKKISGYIATTKNLFNKSKNIVKAIHSKAKDTAIKTKKNIALNVIDKTFDNVPQNQKKHLKASQELIKNHYLGSVKHKDIKSHNVKISVMSGIKTNNLESLKTKLNTQESLYMLIDDLKFQLKNKYISVSQKNNIRKEIILAKKEQSNNRKQINFIKKLL
jgi:hypothetical protein